MKTIKRKEFKSQNINGIITTSQRMLSSLNQIKKASQTNESILIRGESGSGKELIARMIYQCSPRSSNPYYAINCAAFNKELMTSEFFGHKKGSFTGAHQDHPGILEKANTGTLFLDEIAELDLSLQAKLLRVIQEKSFSPVGSTDIKEANIRFISATHKSLRKQVSLGTFREDLMYRLRVLPVFLPPLREREQDLEMLFWEFIQELNETGSRKITSISKEAYDLILDYRWPGNIRELRNNVKYMYYMGEGDTISKDDLLPDIIGSGNYQTTESQSESVNDFDQNLILELLKKHQGKKNAVADELGVSRATLWRRLKQLGIG